MAELDFAILCEFAKVTNGGLSIVGGGFARIEAAQFPAKVLGLMAEC